MKKLHILIAAVAIAVTAGGVGYAAIPASDGTITACADAKGLLKVIDAETGQTCKPGQEQLTWNQGGLSGFETAVESTSYNSSSPKVLTVECPEGKIGIAGGGYSAYPYGTGEQMREGVALVYSRSEGNGWSIGAAEMVPTSESWTLVGFASCVTP